MGCAPSQSEIIQTIAKSTFKPRKKAKALSPVDRTPAESQSCPVGGGPENSDSESNLSKEVQEDTSPRNEFSQQRGRGQWQNMPATVGPTELPKETSGKKLPSSTKTVAAKAASSETRAPQDPSVQKDCDCSNNGNTIQQSKSSRKKGRHAAKQTKSTKLRSRSQSRGENEEKVDFPTSLVEAHQAAYAYLNTSLSKYDTILSLADQAAQAQLTLQQMVSFLTLRFEEINKMLEEVAADGERLVRDVGPHLTWPTEKADPKEQPDLLQQLLLYTVNKMQATNGTVTSLTATVLRETCDYLQSAASIFQRRFLLKQQADKRLQMLIDQLGACTTQPVHTRPRDATLYSEDSGIGADTDTAKEYCTLKEHSNPEKVSRAACCNPSACILCRNSLPNSTPANLARMPSSSSNSCYCAPSRGTVCSSPEERALCSLPSESASNALVSQNRSMGSLGSLTSTEGEALAHSESMDFCSLGEDDEEGSESDSTLPEGPRRPKSTPPETAAVRSTLKRIEKPENEEMTMKIRDAISHKIQFVPTPTASQVWSDEESKPQPARPRSAGGLRRRRPKKHRSRSAESLRSKTEDPTLLELQRTQKDLSRRLDMMHRTEAEAGRQKGAGSPARARPRGASSPVRAERREASSLTRDKTPDPSPKLRASLQEKFNMLPSQERSPSLAKASKLLNDSPNPGDAIPSAASLASRRPSAPTLPLVPHRPCRKPRANSAPVCPETDPTTDLSPVTVLTETDAGTFPPPPTALELSPNTSTLNTRQNHAASEAGDASSSAGPIPLTTTNIVSPSTSGASEMTNVSSLSTTDTCAIGEATGVPVSVPKATVTQRLMASLDSVALLPSKHTGGGASPGGARRLQGAVERGVRLYCGGTDRNQEHPPSAEVHRRSRTAGPLQDWQPYKIINLRYSGDSESRPARPRCPPPCPRKEAASPRLDRREEEPRNPPQRGEEPSENRASFSPSAPRASAPLPKKPCQQSERSFQPPHGPAQPYVNLKRSYVNASQPSENLAQPLVNSTKLAIIPTSSTQPYVHATQASTNSAHPSVNRTQSTLSSAQQLINSTHPSASSTQPNCSTYQPVDSTRASVNSTPPSINSVQGTDNQTHRSVNSSQQSDATTLTSPTIIKKMSPMKLLCQTHLSDKKFVSPPSQPRAPFQATRFPTPSPSTAEKRFTSPPLQPKTLFRPIGYKAPSPPASRRCPDPDRSSPQTLTNRRASPPTISKQQTPPASPTRSCPIMARKLPSPPAHRKLPNPPTQQKQPSPFLHRKLPTPPANCRQPSSTSGTRNHSPPISLGILRKGSTNQLEDDWESQRSVKTGSNASSIFCPLYNSIFEAKSLSVNCFGAPDANDQLQSQVVGDGSPMMSRAVWRNNFILRKPGDRHRRLTLSGVHPQPFVKRNYLLDCKIGTQGRVSASTSATSEPTLHSIG
ncbi:photoreceptor cilium actin regulator-like [Hypanus sabinus]|uniref:photoreceptor cilium actin regulator-like n=1 Tax=Hypanus sabinus TaxID=79690 RepID=UPI0028C45685|nr:photoreceptor cilium actin regulator-like [Hypanus sabinus]